MTEAAGEDLAVKRTAVKLLSAACDGLVAPDAPLAAALLAALRSPNDPLFIYNYGVAEAEFGLLPRAIASALMSRCKSRIAENQDDILAEIRSLRQARRGKRSDARREKKKAGTRRPNTAVTLNLA